MVEMISFTSDQVLYDNIPLKFWSFCFRILRILWLIFSWVDSKSLSHIFQSLMISSFIGLFFGVCSGLAYDYYALLIFRFGVGIGVGGAPQT